MPNFEYLPINSNDPKFELFFTSNQEDIEAFFPDFDSEELSFSEIHILEIESKLAGIFIYQVKGESVHIELDYVIPDFRNQGIGQAFIPEMLDQFKTSGFRIVYACTANDDHKRYLASLGFTNSKNQSELFEFPLK